MSPVGTRQRVLVGPIRRQHLSGREDADPLFSYATYREREHARRRGVEPLDVIDRQEQRGIDRERTEGGNERT